MRSLIAIETIVAKITRLALLAMLAASPLHAARSHVREPLIRTTDPLPEKEVNGLPSKAQLSTILRHPQLVIVHEAGGGFNLKLCRCPVPIAAHEIPSQLRWALIDTEDRRFYSWSHRWGFDPIGIGAAFVSYIRGGRRGGSSLNQQIAKNLVVGGKRTLRRKVQELVLAMRIEDILTKEEIIAAYLNTADFGTVDGHVIIGIEQAARAYFGKPTRSLNLYESAVLVGMLNAPTRYNPLRHPEAARQRAELVMSRMIRGRHLAKMAAETALRTGAKPGNLRPIPLETGYYIAWILQAFQHLNTVKGDQELRVVIGLDPQLQIKAQTTVKNMLRRAEGLNAQQAAFITMDSGGLVRVLIGGRSFKTSQFDRATSAERPPGSVFKPFVYLHALEAGRKPSDKVLDEPFTRAESLKLHVPENWPKNFEHKYEGTVSLRQALAKSLNAATAHLAMEVDLRGIADTARKLGIESRLPGDIPSLALGSSGIVPLELTAAYTVFLNGGRRVKPYGIITILTTSGSILLEKTGEPGPQVISPMLAETMADMLHEVIKSGTGWRANFGYWAAGKTGTTTENRDAWFVGFDRHNALVTTIWIGNDDNAPMKEEISGGTLPAAAWRQFYLSLRGPRHTVVAQQ